MSFKVDNSRIAKNTIVLYIRMGITMLISFFTARITLQILGVDDYGLNNLVGSVVALFSFINASMGTAVQRFYSIEIGKGDESKLNKIFGTSLYLHIIITLITVFIAEVFAIFFLNKLNIPAERMFAAQVVFQISIFTLSLNIINVPYSALLRAREEFSKIAIVEIVQSLFRLCVLYLLFRIDYDKLIILSILNLMISIYSVVSITVIARKYDEAKAPVCKDKGIMKTMIKFVSMLTVTVLSSLFRDQGLVILINLFFGLTINAAYAIAMQVMAIVTTFVMNFKQSVVPQIMSAYGCGDILTMNKLINTGTKITFILMLVISMPIIFESQAILNLWLGTPPQYSAKLVSLVLINVNISSFTYFLYQGIHATGNIVKQQIAMSFLYVLNVILIYIVFKLKFDFYYAIYITISISLLQCVTNIYFANRLFHFNVKCFFANIMRKLFATTFLCFILFYIVNTISSSYIRIGITFFVTVLFAVLFGYYLILNKSERNTCISIVKKLL